MKKLIIAGVAVIAIGLGAWYSMKPADAPTLRSIEKIALKTWNRIEPYYQQPHESVNCDYDPSKFKPSYKFACHVYDSKSYEIGTVTVTVQAGGNANDGWPLNMQVKPL